MSPSKREPSPLAVETDDPQPLKDSDSFAASPRVLGLGFEPTEPVTTPTQRVREEPRSAWKNMPGFEELDQSWAEQSQPNHSQPASAINLVAPSSDIQGELRPTNPSVAAIQRNSVMPDRLASSAAEASFFDAKATLPSSQRADQSNDEAGPSKDSNAPPQAVTEGAGQDLLQPGPSRAAMRKRSEEVSKSSLASAEDGSQSAPETGTEATRFSSRASIRPRASSHDRVPTGSQRRLSRDGTSTVENGENESHDNSSTLAGVTASEGAGATFLHHSDASDLPPILRPAWKGGQPGAVDPRTPGGKKNKSRGMMGGDMFTPLKLQTMFETPTPPELPPVESGETADGAGTAAASTQEEPTQLENPSLREPSPSASQNLPLTPQRQSRDHLSTIPPTTAFTFRSPLDTHAPDSPFAHIATPRTAQRKRGLSVEAFAHLGRLSVASSAGTHAHHTAGQSLPMRLFLFPGSKPQSGQSSAVQSPQKLKESSQVDQIQDAVQMYQERLLAEAAENQEGMQLPDTRKEAGEPDMPERKRIRLYQPPTAELQPTEREKAPLAVVTVAQAEQRTRDESPSLPSLSPLRLSMRRLPLVNASQSVVADESPRKLFRKYSAADQVDKEIEQERETTVEPHQNSDDEKRRETELAAQEERLRHNRELREARRSQSPRQTALPGFASDPPRLVVSDENGGSATVQSHNRSRNQSHSSALRSASTLQRNSLSSTLVEPFEAAVEEQDVPVKASDRWGRPPAAMSTLGRGTQLAEPLLEASNEISSIAEVSAPRSESADKLDSLRAQHGSVSPEARTPQQMTSNESWSASDLRGLNGRGKAGSTLQPPRPSRSVPRTGTPPILRPTYALQHLNSLPKSASGLRNEVVADADETISTTSSLSSIAQGSVPDASVRLEVPDALVQRKTPPAATPDRRVDANTTPRSILKSGMRTADQATPSRPGASLEPPRSISFADGKSSGRVFAKKDANTLPPRPSARLADESWDDEPPMIPGPSIKSSTLAAGSKRDGSAKRAARIQELLEQVRLLALGGEENITTVDVGTADDVADDSGDTEETLRAASSTSRLCDRSFPVNAARRSFAQSSRAGNMTGRSVWNFNASAADQTFLTQASFNVAHDRMVEVLTDVAPFAPDWENLETLDLSNRRLESLVRLKDFVPSLSRLHLDHNAIAYLTGLPSEVRLLTASYNRIPSIVSFGHLRNLETLDVSNNEMDDLSSLEVLSQLRHLKADNNGISSLHGIDRLEQLHTLSLRGNKLRQLDFTRTQWRRMSELDVSHNSLMEVRSLGLCRNMKIMNLSSNALSRLDLGSSLPRLRVLRVSGNRSLDSLDVLPARELRTLYADFCALTRIDHLGSLTKLENLSVRQQFTIKGGGFRWPASQVKDARRLYLSGNALSLDAGVWNEVPFASKSSLPSSRVESLLCSTMFSNLVYLEMAACQLETLPSHLASWFPMLHQLNLDHNLLSLLPSGCFSGFSQLKRVSLMGCRIKSTRSLVEAFEGCHALSVLDTRMNPATLGLYPPVLAPAPSPDSRTPLAYIAPMPNLATFRPDEAQRQWEQSRRDQRQREADVYEKSFFHKRHATPDWHESDDGTSSTDKQQDCDGSALSPSALYALADSHFSRTLPKTFALSRTLHRGTLGLVCPSLVWLDGLVIEEGEVEAAEAMLLKEDIVAFGSTRHLQEEEGKKLESQRRRQHRGPESPLRSRRY